MKLYFNIPGGNTETHNLTRAGLHLFLSIIKCIPKCRCYCCCNFVCLKIFYAINMQHRVFIALFVPFCLTLCFFSQCALSSFNVLLSACVGAVCVLTTTHRGGSLELATINVCIVAYSLCLTGHTTSALLLSPVHCLLHHPPHTHMWCGQRGNVHSCSASENLHRVSLCLLLLMLTMLKLFFLESLQVSCTTASCAKYSITAARKVCLPFIGNFYIGRAAFSFIY